MAASDIKLSVLLKTAARRGQKEIARRAYSGDLEGADRLARTPGVLSRPDVSDEFWSARFEPDPKVDDRMILRKPVRVPGHQLNPPPGYAGPIPMESTGQEHLRTWVADPEMGVVQRKIGHGMGAGSKQQSALKAEIIEAANRANDPNFVRRAAGTMYDAERPDVELPARQRFETPGGHPMHFEENLLPAFPDEREAAVRRGAAAFAEQKGYKLRDLDTPGNIMRNREGAPVIVDPVVSRLRDGNEFLNPAKSPPLSRVVYQKAFPGRSSRQEPKNRGAAEIMGEIARRKAQGQLSWQLADRDFTARTGIPRNTEALRAAARDVMQRLGLKPRGR